MNGSRSAERFDTVVIGGGQAGLTTGYHLRKRGIPFVILDASPRIGDAWRNRWDSLRLFTPARYDGLPGWRFPASPTTFPTKDEMADYLEAYAARFDLPVRSRVGVDRLWSESGRFVLASGGLLFEADRVVVATGAHRIPRVPPFAHHLDPAIVQLHSNEYRNPSQLRDGGVLLVGAGNSGAEIANEVCRMYPTWLAGPDAGHVPVRHGRAAARFAFPVVRFIGHHVLTKGTPIGRKVGPKLVAKADPLIRIKPKDLEAAGVRRVPRVVGERDGMPLLEDDRVLDVANVVWCTGFRSDFGWIDLPVFGEDGQPVHTRGVVDAAPGLYFVGLVFQYSLSSDVLPNRGRDAEYVVKHMASRPANAPAAPGPRIRTAPVG